MFITFLHKFYYRRDHLGNNVAVWNATEDSTVQRTFYYASGLPMSCSTGQATQSRKYNGKEYVEDHEKYLEINESFAGRRKLMPQHKAVREALTNAIIHADFVANGILKVEKLDDAFVFTNPGMLKLPVEQIYAGGESKARNQRMQNMLRMIGYGENIGSGFPLILSAWNEKHWMKPELIEQPELLQVKLKLSLVNSEATGNGGQKSTPKSTPKSTMKGTLKGTRKNIVEMIESNHTITLNEIAEQLGKNPRGIDKHIKQLQDQGIIRRIGPAKGGHWEIITSED